MEKKNYMKDDIDTFYSDQCKRVHRIWSPRPVALQDLQHAGPPKFDFVQHTVGHGEWESVLETAVCFGAVVGAGGLV